MHNPHTAFRIAAILSLSTFCAAQTLPPPPPVPQDELRILLPTVDKANGRISIAGNFWKEDVADWVETALSGRPSDFLHETMICTTTTRTILENAFRDAGFHDADAWVNGVHDFPRVRGDRFLILIEFTADGKPQRYSLDELIAFQGWGVSAGPYGFMFKGDPGKALRSPPLIAPTPTPATEESARTRILRDDPQIATTFKGLQNMSQSFADHPLAYDDWIYPMMNMGRNYSALAPKVLTANLDVPITITFQKVTEEQFLAESAKLFHDAGWQAAITQCLPIAHDIDRNKSDLWKILEGRRAAGAATAPGGAPSSEEKTLIAHIESGYATLDAAWAKYAVDHADFKIAEPQALAMVKDQAARWAQHEALKQQSTAARAMAQDAADAAEKIQAKRPRTAADDAEAQRLNGVQLEQEARALAADNQQERDFWKNEKAHLDPTDPRSAWRAAVDGHLELIAARDDASAAGIAYGQSLQAAAAPPSSKQLETTYARALTAIQIAQTRIQLAEVQFEITKREGFEDDPDLPTLHKKKQALETDLQHLTASTQPSP